MQQVAVPTPWRCRARTADGGRARGERCRRLDIHGGPKQKLQSEAGYIDARPQTRQLDENLLQRTAGPYISGSSGSQTSGAQVRHLRISVPLVGVLARQPEILFARRTLPPAPGEELGPLFRPHSATDHRTMTPRSPRMAAMRAAPPSSLR
jgi:hypothetical protein